MAEPDSLTLRWETDKGIFNAAFYPERNRWLIDKIYEKNPGVWDSVDSEWPVTAKTLFCEGSYYFNENGEQISLGQHIKFLLIKEEG